MKRRRFKSPRFNTVIGEQSVITGDVVFEGGMHIDGTIIGNISSKDGDDGATLTLSERGAIEGDVRVANVIVNGVIKGDVYASSRVELAEQARITGKVHYHLLEMSMGAEVNGEMISLENGMPEKEATNEEEPSERPEVEQGHISD